MLRRLPPDHPDPDKRGKLQFMYKTLFEVKLEELVRGGEKTARLIGEAADKCTQVRSNALVLLCSNAFNGDPALDSDRCFRLRRSIRLCTPSTQTRGQLCAG